MVRYCTLEKTDNDELYRAFTLAFSDYSVKIDMPYERFLDLLKRNGYVPELSAAAYQGDELAGFIINGVRMRGGKKTAYDSGTGVIPAFRKQGLTTGMLGFLMGKLRAGSVEQYLLEVITANEPAYSLYRKQGFKPVRKFSCYRKLRPDAAAEPDSIQYFRGIPGEYESVFPSFWDFQPSWQNSVDSVRSVSKDCITAVAIAEGRPAGYGILHEPTGAFLQMAVSPGDRGKGIGAALLDALAGKALFGEIYFTNVDSESESMNRFLQNRGFSLYVEQYEMIKDL